MAISNSDKCEMKASLLRAIEEVYGSEITTPKEFEALRRSILERTGSLLSATTLKRLWGYLNEPQETRRSTLDILARYAGWGDYAEFCAGNHREAESGTLAAAHINVARDLDAGRCLRLTWLPDRVCDVRYLGDCLFEVLRAEGTRLAAGDTFTCDKIISGEVLYLDSLCHGGANLGVYVCGRRHGVGYVLLPEAE